VELLLVREEVVVVPESQRSHSRGFDSRHGRFKACLHGAQILGRTTQSVGRHSLYDKN
jgi:hypothetical protein